MRHIGAFRTFICLAFLPSLAIIAYGDEGLNVEESPGKRLAVGQTEKGVGIRYSVPEHGPLRADEFPAVAILVAPGPKELPLKTAMEGKEIRWPRGNVYPSLFVDGKKLVSYRHISVQPSNKLSCYRMVLHDTDKEDVRSGFVLCVSFRDLLDKKYTDPNTKVRRPSFDPRFLGDSPQIIAVVCAFKIVDGSFVFQRFLSGADTLKSKRIAAAIHAEAERLSKEAIIPTPVENRRAAVAALRDAKTASVQVAWFTIDGEQRAEHWNDSLRGSFRDILKAAGIRVDEEKTDVEFVMHLKVVQSNPATYRAGPAPGAMSMTIATKTGTQGIVLLKKSDTVVHSIPLGGTHAAPSSFTLGRGSNPIIGALRSSGFHKELLALLVEARGPEMLKPIIEKYKMVMSVSTDWGGGWTAYQSLFDVLAESHTPEAEKMLEELANDSDSNSARRLAKEAIERQKNRRLPNKAIDRDEE